VGLRPYELLYQKKFAQSFSQVNAVHQFAPSQNHKTVLYNPKRVKATGAVSLKELQSKYTNLQTNTTL
jgi:hypothetical protein